MADKLQALGEVTRLNSLNSQLNTKITRLVEKLEKVQKHTQALPDPKTKAEVDKIMFQIPNLDQYNVMVNLYF